MTDLNDAMPGASPFEPGDTWQKPRGAKRRARLADMLADAIDREERASAKMRRAFQAWDRARLAVARLNARIVREGGAS